MADMVVADMVVADMVVADTRVFHNCMENTVNYKTYLILYKVFKNALHALKIKIYYIFILYVLAFSFYFFSLEYYTIFV